MKAQELEKANAELKEIDRLKSDFLSNVSHELRTPLTSIRSFTEIMLDDPQSLTEVERREFLGIIATQTERLTRLISDLLDLSRIEAGEMRCRFESVALPRIIDPCLETLRTLTTGKQIRVHTEIEPDLPAVLADPDRISQVITNLMDNAIKFTPPRGSITVTARACASRSPHVLGAPSGGPTGMTSTAPEAAGSVDRVPAAFRLIFAVPALPSPVRHAVLPRGGFRLGVYRCNVPRDLAKNSPLPALDIRVVLHRKA